MYYFLAVLLALLPPPQSARDKSLPALLDGVERAFARMKDFSADFTHLNQDSLNRRQEATGHLYLMRPRMMRWEYKSPEEQYFVSDGKTVYFYVPADRQVHREAVRETFDDRMPLMFLLGRSNLQSEFTRFVLRPADIKPLLQGTQLIRMYP